MTVAKTAFVVQNKTFLKLNQGSATPSRFGLVHLMNRYVVCGWQLFEIDTLQRPRKMCWGINFKNFNTYNVFASQYIMVVFREKVQISDHIVCNV